MKNKQYKYGPHKCRAYMKSVGKGYEVGFYFGSNPIFVGNFLHKKEANAWWTKMNTEIKTFSSKFGLTPKAPVAFYKKFFSNHLYQVYYKYLDKQFSQYTRQYDRVCKTSEKQYKKIKLQKSWTKKDHYTLKKAA